MAAPRAPFDPTDPELLTAEQRLDELASLLAAGAARLLRTRSTPALQIDPDSSPNRLDSPPEQSVYGRPRG